MKSVFDIDSLQNYFGAEQLLSIVILVAALFGALMVHFVAFKILHRFVQRSSTSRWNKVLVKSRRVSRWMLILFALELTIPLQQIPPGLALFCSHLVRLLFIAILGWLALLVLNGLMEYSMGRHRIDVEDNLEARKIRTRLRVLRQALALLIVMITIASMLMTFPGARSIGVSLFASAGVAGIVVGFAARPVLSNLLAGLQIALTQPIRIDDAVVIEGEWGWIEEITPTYVVVKIWDWRRLVVPLSYVIEKPFQNWTRETAAIIGSVFWHTDYSVPVEAMREKLKKLLQESKFWDGDVQVLQVVDCLPHTMQLRALMSAKNSPTAWDLRCEIREKMIAWLQQEYPGCLPKTRAEVGLTDRLNVEA